MKPFLHRLVPCALFLVPLLFSCENDEKKVTALTKNVVMTEEAKDIESFLSQDGRMRARLKAPAMLRVFTDTLYVEFPNTLHVDFYDQNNQVETFLDSRYGKYFETLNKVYLRDSVVVINIKGDTLKSPDLWWDQNTKMFYTDKYAQYHSKDKNIYGGKGLEATQDLTSITFKYPTGTVQVSETGFPK
jgi:LPS export ABC transporter protein LptC